MRVKKEEENKYALIFLLKAKHIVHIENQVRVNVVVVIIRDSLGRLRYHPSRIGAGKVTKRWIAAAVRVQDPNREQFCRLFKRKGKITVIANLQTMTRPFIHSRHCSFVMSVFLLLAHMV